MRVRPDAPVTFLAGQYLTLGLAVGDRVVERPYSVASSPQDAELEFFLEVVPGGKLSPQLYEVPVGGEVFIRPLAKGRFNLDVASGNPGHLMAATVTGVAPFLSMVRELAASTKTPPYRILLLHAASVSAELAYQDELESLASTHEWFDYVPAVSRIWLDSGWQGERGRIEDLARKHMDARGFGPASTTAYLCGNPHMIRNMEGILERAGFPRQSVKKEIYWPAA